MVRIGARKSVDNLNLVLLWQAGVYVVGRQCSA